MFHLSASAQRQNCADDFKICNKISSELLRLLVLSDLFRVCKPLVPIRP